ncbi:YjbH domain-containing protein [Sulfitobacter sediminilitoris]|uniref:YjbH domain-containing protein n=1 Tax=Sulfitobacter sediminilitoris TaxID=2698830 RepID=UPI002E2D4F98|nr:YjbH domain-containing protein [Sulfitobacter sediminilitoris]
MFTRSRRSTAYFTVAFASTTALAWTFAAAQSDQTSLSTYGTPGLVETPTARSLNDGELAFTSSLVGPTLRNTVTFQIWPRVSGSFRYTRIDGAQGDGSANYDRSFDIAFQLLDETDLRPAVALGLRDFLGTGLYSGEYLVATKQFGSRLEVTGGIGWGRFAARDGFTNPLGILDDRFETRPGGLTGKGGQVETGNWFRGDAAIFGGIAYHLNDRTTLFAEYSTDTYERDSNQGLIDIDSPLNVGVQYRFRNGVDLKAFVVGGNEIGAQLSYVIDPRKRASPGGADTAPRPLGNRDQLAIADWNNSARGGGKAAAQRVLDARLAEEGMTLQGFEMSGSSATIRVENNRWGVEAQAAGRAARVMATTLPPNVEELRVVLQERGVPMSQVTTRRSDLEDLQYDYDGSWRTYARAEIGDASDLGRAGEVSEAFPVFDYGLTPYVALSFFDPDEPLRAEAGAQFKASYRPAPGLTFSGKFRYPFAGNIEDSARVSDSAIEPVRTNAVLYARESELEINTLTAEYMFRPGKDLFGRVTAGYLEDMFGGVSAELLWYPVGSRLALGAEVNYARQRDFDMLFGFQDYDVVTGHASAYYDFGNGFQGQIDAGRYLAGDWGATIALDREFNNGFRVGGYFTLTDVSSDDFGEGSFDKGIRFEVPLSWVTGRPSKTTLKQTIRPIQRDGGARLNVDNRLHRFVRDYRGQELRDGWGRYLR